MINKITINFPREIVTSLKIFRNTESLKTKI